ncbi:hypothetical protein ES703_12775 [subsurface metagenome]
MKGKIFQAFLILVLVVVVAGFAGCVKTQEEATSPEPSLPPEFFLDSDGDGFNDWFETNIAYDPNVPNDRFIILYGPAGDKTDDPGYQFFNGKGEVPPENIIRLYGEEANAANLESAIDEIASKSDENDIVFLYMVGHGGGGAIEQDVEYTMLDEWLDKVNAMAIVVTIMACGCEEALPILKDGSCPRIVFVHSAGEFIRGLGDDDGYFTTADTKYGNGEGYVSVGEIGNWIDNDPKWGPDWGELHEEGRSHLEAEGYSKMSDTSNVASEIYLTDYTPTE